MHDYLAALEGVKLLFQEAEPIIQQRAAEHRATCTKGCDHCCYLMATPTLAEMLLVVDHLVQKPDWRALLPRLVEAGRAVDYPGVNRPSYFEKHIPCIFLKDHLCSIYEVRPACCRFHLVASPPDNCSLTGKDKRVALINAMDLEHVIWDWTLKLLGQNAPDAYMRTSAPLPLLLAWALPLYFEAKKRFKLARELKSFFAAEGLKTPDEWYLAHGRFFLLDGASVALGRSMTPEEVKSLRGE